MGDVANVPVSLTDLHGVTPLAALKLLERSVPPSSTQRAQWRQQARMSAVLGSMPKSKDGLQSAVNHWLRYMVFVYGADAPEDHAFPPDLTDVLGWSHSFRCVGTYGNYLSLLRSYCHAHGFEAPPCHNMAIKRAMVGIIKRRHHEQKEKTFISKVFVRNMVAAVDTGHEVKRLAMLWLFAYTFLLRLPSEALPTWKGNADSQATSKHQTVIWRSADTVCIRILERKNRPGGSGILYRRCSCDGSPITCAVHMLWDKFFAELDDDAAPWEDISASYARTRVRAVLEHLGVPNAMSYGTHSFRRGHAEVNVALHTLSVCSLSTVLFYVAAVFIGPTQKWCQPEHHTSGWTMEITRVPQVPQ